MMSPVTRFGRARLLTLAVLVSACFGAAAQAQNYPERPIRLIAPFPAGGLADVLARAVGDDLSKSLGDYTPRSDRRRPQSIALKDR